MALYTSHRIFHSAQLLYVRPETFGHYYVQYMTKLTVALRNFSNAPKTCTLVCTETAFMCFVWIAEQTAVISLYSINW
jgi:hypothetical protein